MFLITVEKHILCHFRKENLSVLLSYFHDTNFYIVSEDVNKVVLKGIVRVCSRGP